MKTLLLAGCAVLVLSSTTALALDPTSAELPEYIVGLWCPVAPDSEVFERVKKCRNGGVNIQLDHYDNREEYACDYEHIRRIEKTTWRIIAQCGDPEPKVKMEFTFILSGDKLTITDVGPFFIPEQ